MQQLLLLPVGEQNMLDTTTIAAQTLDSINLLGYVARQGREGGRLGAAGYGCVALISFAHLHLNVSTPSLACRTCQQMSFGHFLANSLRLCPLTKCRLWVGPQAVWGSCASLLSLSLYIPLSLCMVCCLICALDARYLRSLVHWASLAAPK